MKTFEKVSRLYALNYSYFKFRCATWPDTIGEIYDYSEQHGELPFRYTGDNWVYDAMCERQKRRGVEFSQYLTPDGIADKMAELSCEYFPSQDDPILVPCCGTGQLIRALLKAGYDSSTISGFDIDPKMASLCTRIYPSIPISCEDFRDVETYGALIIANPPFKREICTPFLEWVEGMLLPESIAILLLPLGFIDKLRSKRLRHLMKQFEILHRERVDESFSNTNIYTEIVVLKHR